MGNDVSPDVNEENDDDDYVHQPIKRFWNLLISVLSGTTFSLRFFFHVFSLQEYTHYIHFRLLDYREPQCI